MRARPFPTPTTSLALLATATMTVLLGSACERDCRKETLYLEVDLGMAKGATTLIIDVQDVTSSSAPGPSKQTTLMLPKDASTGTVEVEFPTGYKSGTRQQITLTAIKASTSYMITRIYTLADECTRAKIAFPPPPTGAGGSGSGQGGQGGSGSGLGGQGGSGSGLGGQGGSGSGLGGQGGSGSGLGGQGGSGSGLGGTPGVVQLTPDSDGYVQVPSLGVIGPWFAFSDGVGVDGTVASSDCVRAGHAQSACSLVSSPAPDIFPPADIASARMCTSGSVAQVQLGGTGTYDYTNMWGAGIGLDFAHVAGTTTRNPYNTTSHGVLGISFSIDAIPAGLRVEFPTSSTITSAAVYLPGTAANNYASPLVLGRNEIRWSQVMAPSYVTSPPPFDPTTLLGVGFHVPTTNTGRQTYSFCISNLSFILGAL